jgi:hypothetical protein
VPDLMLDDMALQPSDRLFIPDQAPIHVAILSQRLTNLHRLI